MPKTSIAVPDGPEHDLAALRAWARQGTLADRLARASAAERPRLRIAAYHIVGPVAFERLTRPVEHKRRHFRCAISVHHLEPACFDLYDEDVAAAIDDLFRNAKVPILHLEGWIASRLKPVTIDANRRRRGERGALQRPRLPKWLRAALGDDPWYTALALEVLNWVGVPVTAGTEVWPLSAWAERRAAVTGDTRRGDAEVRRDLEAVLAAMRRRPAWYQRYVELPLFAKPAPVVAEHPTNPERSHLSLVEPYETDDARLLDLAALAVAAIEERLARGEAPEAAVASILRTVFGSGTGAEHLDRIPGDEPAEEARVDELLADPRSLDRIVREVLDILS